MRDELKGLLSENVQYLIHYIENEKSEYVGEKIPQINEKESVVYKTYKEFQKIAQAQYWIMSEDTIFYEQAKYLEKFEDNYKAGYYYYGSNYTYTYKGFSFREFRTYFSWRTKIRKGIFEEAAYEYEQIYINELLNQIGCKDANEAISKLIYFWENYRKVSSSIDKRMPYIIKEFYILSDIEAQYTEIIEKYPIDVKKISKDMKEINKSIYSNKLNFFNDISEYKVIKSKFLESQFGYLVEECIQKVFTKIDKELQNINISLPDMLIHKGLPDYWWKPLKNYTICNMKLKNKEIIIEGTEKYEYKNGKWIKTIYSPQKKYRHMIGFILKTIECCIREYVGYRKLIPPEEKNILKDLYNNYYSSGEKDKLMKVYKMNLKQLIQNEVIQHLENTKVPKMFFNKKKQEVYEYEEKVEVVFNKELFDRIREKSEEIQRALVIDEESDFNNDKNEKIIDTAKTIEDTEKLKQVAKSSLEVAEEEVAKSLVEIPKNELVKSVLEMKEKIQNPSEIQTYEVENSNNVFKTFICGLSNMEKEMITILLEKQDVENKMLKIAQKENEMLEVIVSNINDKAIETIGDTIIESSMNSIYEDYENEIKQVL